MKVVNFKYVFVIFAGLMMAVSANTNAQVGKTWSIGAELGPSFSKYGADADNHKLKAGFIGGGFLTYSIINTFAITGKVLYSQKGSRYSDDGSNVRQTLDYLEVPVVGRFFLNKEGRCRPNVYVGPSFGFLLGVKDKKDGGEVVKATENERENFKDVDLGITGGLGLNYEVMPETRLLLDARYTHGLTDVKNPGVFNNRAIGVTAGVSVGF